MSKQLGGFDFNSKEEQFNDLNTKFKILVKNDFDYPATLNSITFRVDDNTVGLYTDIYYNDERVSEPCNSPQIIRTYNLQKTIIVPADSSVEFDLKISGSDASFSLFRDMRAQQNDGIFYLENASECVLETSLERIEKGIKNLFYLGLIFLLLNVL